MNLRRLLPLSVLHRRLLRKLLASVLGRKYMTRRIYGQKMILPIRSGGIGTGLAIFGERELDQRDILKDILRSGNTVLDIGANIGYYPLVEYSLVKPSGRIYAYEPDPRNVEILHQNIMINGAQDVIEVFEGAVSSSEGSAILHLAELSNLNALELSKGGDSEVLIARNMHKRRYVGEAPVTKRDICNILLRAERKIDLIRMDIEGHEVEVLNGMVRGLEDQTLGDRAPKYIVFEPHSWEYDANPNSLERVLGKLSAHGYRITALGTRHEISSPIAPLGYTPAKLLRESSGRLRGVYRDVPPQEAMRLASSVDGVTTVLLEHNPQEHS